MTAAADDKGRMEGTPRRLSGWLIAQIHAPANARTVVRRGAMRRITVHENDSALANRYGARRRVRQQVGADRRSTLRLVLPIALLRDARHYLHAAIFHARIGQRDPTG